MSTLHLESINVKYRTAVVAVDNADGVNLAGWYLRLHEGEVKYFLQEPGTEPVLETAATVREAVEALTGQTEAKHGAIANPIGYAADGLDDMGLWTALGA